MSFILYTKLIAVKLWGINYKRKLYYVVKVLSYNILVVFPDMIIPPTIKNVVYDASVIVKYLDEFYPLNKITCMIMNTLLSK